MADERGKGDDRERGERKRMKKDEGLGDGGGGYFIYKQTDRYGHLDKRFQVISQRTSHIA